MKVMSVIHYPVFGGPHNQALRLDAPLRALGVETLVVLPDEPGNAVARLETAGVEHVTIPLLRLRASKNLGVQSRFLRACYGDVGRLRSLIRSHDVDVVQLNGLVNPHAAIAARLENVPVVWQILDTRSPMFARVGMAPLIRALADCVMTTGKRVAEMHPGVSGLGGRLLPYFPPVDVDLFSPATQIERNAARAKLGVPDDAFLVGTVGNLNPQKGHEFLIRAAAVARERIPTLFLRILGASTLTHAGYAESTRVEANELRFTSPQFDMIDPGARVAELIRAFDVFVMSAVPLSEGVPTVILEAMASGIPVVATDVGGVSEVVKDGVTGFVVPALDSNALGNRIVDIYEDRALRDAMSRAARQDAEQLYSSEQCAQVHLNAYRTALQSHWSRFAPTQAGGQDVCIPSPDLRDALVCPDCRGAIEWSTDAATCQVCATRYPVVRGVPVLVSISDIGGEPVMTDSAEAQRFYDEEVDAQFETTRPHRTPRMHQFMLGLKVRHGLRGLDGLRGGGPVLAVCGGSGMDGEFLARCGHGVLSMDLSLGACLRASERARRFGLPIFPVVADAMRLPLLDKSISVAYVHDGLHHLSDPADGVAEMLRVARLGVSINEPAAAVATRAAVALGVAVDVEESGDVVRRVRPRVIAAQLGAAGFHKIRRYRYGMYYRHDPGPLVKWASGWPIFPLARESARLASWLTSPIGNKCAVTGLGAPSKQEDRP
ncbi:MAG: glycosyltransferase [Actinomycetia bacterium]|nr:glycosyltransferase [Actinomycetes bacterium]